MRLPSAWLLGVFVAAAAGCGGDRSVSRGGAVVIAAFAEPDNLVPPLGRTVAAKAVTDQIFDPLAETGPGEGTLGDAGFAPRLSRRWEWSPDSSRVTFHLDPAARWHDGRPVTASDVRFSFSLYTDSTVNANGGVELGLAVDSVTVRDSLTCTAWFRKLTPERFFTLVSTLVPLPEHLLARTPRDSLLSSAFARAPVGSGPFRFVRSEPGSRLEIAAVDGFYRGRAKLDRVIWSFSPQMTTAIQAVYAGAADFIEALPPPAVADAARHPGVLLKPYGTYDYGFVRFNLHDGGTLKPHPLFGNRELRRALTMALDRAKMLRSVFDTLARPGLGPFVRAQWSSDTTVTSIAFDGAAAARALDSLGWRAGADGIRRKDGRLLEFAMLVPASSKSRGAFAVLIQEQLRLLGVSAKVETVDFKAFIERARGRNFDALLDGIHSNPSPAGISQSWSSTGIARGHGPNYGGYVNARFDAQVDSALRSIDLQSAKALYRRAYQTIIDDAPAIWLFEPIAVAGVNSRVDVGGLHPGNWWNEMRRWAIR